MKLFLYSFLFFYSFILSSSSFSTSSSFPSNSFLFSRFSSRFFSTSSHSSPSPPSLSSHSSFSFSNHSIYSLLQNRKNENTFSFNRTDNFKLGLSFEGGGMRGCIGAGAVLTLKYLQINNLFDCIYGSSAGSMIGSYFISKQFNCAEEIYCNLIPKAKPKFIKPINCGKEILPYLYRSHNNLFDLDYLL